MDSVVELKPFGGFWQVTHNDRVIAYAVNRRAAVNVTAALLRRQLKDPRTTAELTFVGLELAELLEAPSMDPNWKRKGPRIEIELFEQAEAYLRTELIPADEAALLGKLRTALQAERFGEALDCLVQLGEFQGCTNPYWRVLERLAEAVWPTQWMVDRRAKGQVESKVAAIKRRARGRA